MSFDISEKVKLKFQSKKYMMDMLKEIITNQRGKGLGKKMNK